MNWPEMKYFCDMRVVGTGPVQCIMVYDDSYITEVCYVGDHSRPTPILSKFILLQSE